MTPELVFSRAMGCFLIGVLLGPCADALRPLHRRFPRLTEVLISAELAVCWLQTFFGICRGDLRIGYYLAMMAGFLLWERFFGGAVSSLAGKFWHFAAIPVRFCLKFFRKIVKFLFARRKKWSTIE